MKFNSSVCTSIEQSQRLLELGLKPETADMIYMQIDGSWICIISQGDEECIPYEDHFPAWSLHRLLEIYSTSDDDYLIYIDRAFDELIDDIEWSINKGCINKEYLKQ